GLGLKPHDHQLLATLVAHGIRLDSSIAKGLSVSLDTLQIDYRNMPEQANWFMAPETGIGMAAPEGILEVPIASFQVGLGSTLGFLWRRALSMGKIRGSGISRHKHQTRLATAWTLFRLNLRYLCGRPYFLFSADTKGLTARILTAGF